MKLLLLILVSIFSYLIGSDIYKNITNDNITHIIYSIVKEPEHTKESLLQLSEQKELEIIDTIISKISKKIIEKANEGKKMVYWTDNWYFLTDEMKDKIIIKLKDKYNNIKVKYDHPYIVADWS